MVITILLFLLSDATANEKYRFERLQGQCSAWCYQRFGVFEETDLLGTHDKVQLYKCSEEDAETSKECHSCNNACSVDFNNLAECYGRCENPREPCSQACDYHQAQSRVPVDEKFLSAYSKNVSKNYPIDIHEIPSGRTSSSLQFWWGYVNQFDDPTAVVFLVFLLNITSSDPNPISLTETQGLYMGSTSLYNYKIRNLSPDYCYMIRMLSVTREYVFGSGLSSKMFTTEGVIHTENVTATSATIWFKIRPCESKIEHTMKLFYGTLTNLKDKRINVVIEESILKAKDVEDLIPNKEYSIQIQREYKDNGNELFSIHGKLRTLLAAPQSTVTVTAPASEITATSIQFIFEISDEELIWGAPIKFYNMKLWSTNGQYSKEVEIRINLSSGSHTVTDLEAYVEYCVSMLVANEKGLGPYSPHPVCTTTLSAAADDPAVKVLNVTSLHVWVEVTRPDPPNGELSYYKVSYIESDELKEVKYPLEVGSKQKILITKLDPDTSYQFKVQVVNHKEEVGEPAVVQVTTLQSYPGVAPEVSTCSVSSNDTHVSSTVTWVNIDDDLVNGEIVYYEINLVQQLLDSLGIVELVSNETYSSANWSFGVIEVTDKDLKLKYSEQELVTIRLRVATHVGPGPWSEAFQCEIVQRTSMGKDVITPVIIVVCIAGVCIFLLFVFMYFFRFKPYKKTPYEEIPKLIGPDTFSPCQHCLHNKEPKRWDVFICHVSEDIDYIVKLKDAFVREKIEVFFAKDELSWGCELHRVINDGLRFSKYGLVIISREFVNKCSKWTSSELSSLHSKSKITSQDCILPIWKKDISELEVGEFDMTLVGIKALKEEEMSVDQMAVELKKKLKSSGSCCNWGCKNFDYHWSTSDYSQDNSPCDSLNTTLL